MGPKHFISDSSFLVDEMCKSLLYQNPGLKYDPQYKVLSRTKDDEEARVAIVSGGGSGHEPAHAGYVGKGMLDAAVCGAVFASPNVEQVLEGLRQVASSRGVLLIVKNYTGDKLNFGLAAETFCANYGIPVRMVLVEDDVAVPRSRGQMVGRRGLAGTIFVHKIAGAAAATGITLDEIVQVAQHVADNVATIGVSLDYCSVPGSQEAVSLPAATIELGMGIHNEPGTNKLSPQPNITVVVDTMLRLLLDTTYAERGFLTFNSSFEVAKTAVLINNLGGLSVLELQAIASTALEQLTATYQIRPLRVFVGTYLTSLNGPGFSVSILNLGAERGSVTSDSLISFLDAPTHVPAWAPSLLIGKDKPTDVKQVVATYAEAAAPTSIVEIPYDPGFFEIVIQSVLREIVEQEPDITKFDTLMGDGDCGATLLSGIRAVDEVVRTGKFQSLSQALVKIASAVRVAMGFTSGALYGLFLNAFASSVQDIYAKDKALSVALFAKSAQQALTTLERFTRAREGSRTLMDALIPFVKELGKSSLESACATNAISRSLDAARLGTEATKTMKSSFGRSTYVGAGGESDTEDPTHSIPDPGACGIVAIGTGILAAFRSKA